MLVGILGLGMAGAALAGPDGALLFREHCASCHGPEGRGDGVDAFLFDPPPRDLTQGVVRRMPRRDLVRRIRDGRPLPLLLDRVALAKRTTDVELLVAHLRKLPTIPWGKVERGQELYVDRCELCHGPYGTPGRLASKVRPPRDLSSPDVHAMGDEELRLVARHGRRGMPAVRDLPDGESLDGLVAFLRLLSPGYTLYSRYCANCHGDDGHPNIDLVEAFAVPRVHFDAGYMKSHDDDRLRRAVWHMLDDQTPQMPHFRDTLDEPSANAIADWLRRGASR